MPASWTHKMIHFEWVPKWDPGVHFFLTVSLVLLNNMGSRLAVKFNPSPESSHQHYALLQFQKSAMIPVVSLRNSLEAVPNVYLRVDQRMV